MIKMRAQLLQSQARIIIHGNRSLMHRAFYCVILHVFQKLVYTYQLYAQNEQLRCLNQLVDRREGRGDTDVGVMRILLIRVGCPDVYKRQLCCRLTSVCLHSPPAGLRLPLWMCPHCLCCCLTSMHLQLPGAGLHLLQLRPRFPAAALLPVSYTHLDVYKRQLPESVQT